MLRDLEDFYREWKYVIFIVLLVVTIGLFSYFGIYIYRHNIVPKKVFMSELVIDCTIVTPETHYAPTKEYFERFGTAQLPESYTEYGTYTSEEKQQAYVIIDDNARFNEEVASFTQEYEISNANQELYNIADKYYQVYWGSQRVSPVYALAVANVETGGRADHSITWSALFPSKYVAINKLYTMDVTTVVSDDSIYKPLSTESSTRDRGALQMSPSYGTGNAYFNSLMSGTEKEKLMGVSSSHTNWIAGASDKPGDRFYVPDVCLRLSAANTDAITRITENDYTPDSDTQLIVMLAMYHHRSGVWSNKDRSKKVGEWNSSGTAYEYSKLVSSKAVTQRLRQYAVEHEKDFWIDATVAKQVFREATGRDMSEFASNTIVCTYPVKVLYAYIKLCIMYAE